MECVAAGEVMERELIVRAKIRVGLADQVETSAELVAVRGDRHGNAKRKGTHCLRVD